MKMKRVIGAAGALLLALGVPLSNAAEEVPTGNVVVKVSLEDDREFKEGTVFIKDRQVKLKQGTQAVSVLDLPVGGYAATAEVFVSQGWFKPKLRYLGVGPVRVEEDETAEAAIVLQPVETVDAFCSPCHPGSQDKQEWGGQQQIRIRRDLHVSGQAME